MIEIRDVEKLARAVLLFHRGGAWSPTDQRLWIYYTGQSDATTRVLCDLARKVRIHEERRPSPGMAYRQISRELHGEDEPETPVPEQAYIDESFPVPGASSNDGP